MNNYTIILAHGIARFDYLSQQFLKNFDLFGLASGLVNNELHWIGGVEDDRQTNTGRHLVLNLGNLSAGWQNAPAMPEQPFSIRSILRSGTRAKRSSRG
mgnify:CR=1 FL=1